MTKFASSQNFRIYATENLHYEQSPAHRKLAQSVLVRISLVECVRKYKTQWKEIGLILHKILLQALLGTPRRAF